MNQLVIETTPDPGNDEGGQSVILASGVPELGEKVRI